LSPPSKEGGVKLDLFGLSLGRGGRKSEFSRTRGINTKKNLSRNLSTKAVEKLTATAVRSNDLDGINGGIATGCVRDEIAWLHPFKDNEAVCSSLDHMADAGKVIGRHIECWSHA
ncbi:MAG: hypothetical protein QM537_09025, partial [Candidatus Symbiobacter sp.]|nr:hypothetical protein [Candidatus Symbiobacter sp.]